MAIQLAALALALTIVPGQPADAAVQPGGSAPAAIAVAPAPAGERPFSAPVAEDQLSAVTGGAEPTPDPALSNSTLSSTNTGNSVNAAGAIANGQIQFSGAALQNFSGVGNMVFNTGNNSNLEGNITVNVVMAP
jgi:hypothetical protein